MYAVVEQQRNKGCQVCVADKQRTLKGQKVVIDLDTATQKDLQYLYEMQHPFVIKLEKKKVKTEE